MRLIPGLFITVLMAVLVVGCSNSDNGSGRATLVIQFAPPTAKHSARAVDANQTQLPVELTRVVFGGVSPNRRKFRGVSEDGNSSLKQKFTPAASQNFDVREPGSVVGE